MIVSLSWLKRYVDVPVDVKTFAHDLTMLGLKVEHVSSSGFATDAVVVGRVLEVAAHPNADRLRVCDVDVGAGEPLHIVCGASNVAAGQSVPVALVGATLPGGVKIRKSKIRGVVSHGMICSEIELGLGDEAAGIMVLDGPAAEAAPGTALAGVLGSADDVLEIEVTPNRPDQLCHVGVAREVGALYGGELRVPAPSVESRRSGEPVFTVSIEDPADCHRFTGRVIRGVRVGPSPDWLRESLERVGLHSINNIVDVTNFVMLELGQPMHAYDLDRLPARAIVVRRARTGERMRALDDVEYTFRDTDLLITDDDRPIGVAGVIGGMDTSVTSQTRNLLLESAAFDGRVVRRTRKGMNLSTDASYRFERGSDRSGCMAASDRATELIAEIAGGEPGEALDVFPQPAPARAVRIRRSNTRRILGVTLSVDDIGRLLERLHFRVSATDGDGVTVEVPSFRGDVLEEADLIEEVARLHGYDKIGEGWKFRTTTYAAADPFDRFMDDLADHLVARGHMEVMTTAFTDGREVDAFNWESGDPRCRPVPVMNPLTANHGFLRTSLLPGLLDVVRRNIDRGNPRLHLFSAGKVFLAGGGHEGLPNEPWKLAIVRTRPEGPQFWRRAGAPVDLFEIKEEVEALAASQRIDLAEQLSYDFDAPTGRFSYRSKRRANVIEGGVLSGRVAAAWDIEQPLWYAVVDLVELFDLRGPRPSYRAVPEYPVSRRDLSLVAPAGTTWSHIEKTLVKYGGGLLESLQVFDVYRGENLPDDKTAYGARLHFRSAEGTLRDEEVDAVVERIVQKLRSELGVTLRS